MGELISNFGIDWKLLLAQVVNFFILVIILKKFAYGPIIQMLKKRKEEIEKGLHFTKKAEERLADIDNVREATLKEARVDGLAIVARAENSAKGRKEEIIREASHKGEDIIVEARRAIEEEKAKMGEEVYHNAEDLIRAGITRVLGKLSWQERDNQLIKEAMRELKSVKSNESR